MFDILIEKNKIVLKSLEKFIALGNINFPVKLYAGYEDEIANYRDIDTKRSVDPPLPTTVNTDKASRTQSSPKQIIERKSSEPDINFDLAAIKLFLKLLVKEEKSKKHSKRHDNVTCDSCGSSGFLLDRYKCMKCPDYDLCGQCYEKNKFNKGHLVSHPTLRICRRISDKKNSLLEAIVKKGLDGINKKLEEKMEHSGVKCDNCPKNPIKGLRFKCDECIDFDLCFRCFNKGVSVNNHTPKHKMQIFLQEKTSEIKHEDVTFDVDDYLGKGCFGSAYKAKIKGSSEFVCCKVIEINEEMFSCNPLKMFSLLKSFQNEIFNLQNIEGSYIVQYIGHTCKKESEKNYKFYILTEFMENGCLEDILYKKKNKFEISYRRRLQFAMNIISGLRRIHEKNSIHRDLKPDNIFIDNCMRAKIGDLGISKLLQNEELNYMQTKSMTGPRFYVPPEFLTGHYDRSADIYSFGIVLYEIFEETKPNYDVINRKVLFVKKSRFFGDLIEKCVNVNFKERPSAKYLEEKFEKFEKGFWKLLQKKNITQKKYMYESSLEEKNDLFVKYYNNKINEF